MQDARSKVASEWIADVLADRILTGQLKPGDRIKQDELAADLDISRIPVRDALRILETRGLVSLKANSGARVSSLSPKDMEMSYQIRETVDPLLLADSMPGLTEDDLEEMAGIKLRMETTDDVDEFLVLNRLFHWTSFRRHSAPVLAQISERLWDTTHSYRRTYASRALQDAERRAVMCAERDLLFGSIRRREFDLAPRLLAVHIRRTRVGLLDFFRQQAVADAPNA